MEFLKRNFWLFAAVFGTIISAMVILVLGTYVYYLSDLASTENLMNRNNTGIILTDRSGKTFFKGENAKELNVYPLSKIPKNFQNATIAIEDKDFVKHPGFSLPSMMRALWADVITGEPKRFGASTITQQLVKNALLTPEKSIRRKLQEIILAFEIERKYTKEQILEMYLNSIYYGAGAYGVEQAAKTYFAVSPEQLTLPQSALLAALPQAPSFLTPFGGDSQRLEERKVLVLRKMAEYGYITPDESSKAQNVTIKYTQPPQEPKTGDAPHFAVFVRDALFRKYGEETANRLGLRVRTTLDLSLQQYAQNALANQIKALSRQNVTNGAIIVLDPNSGEILSMVGSVDWDNNVFGKYNASLALRQPGSSFKPIVYTRAIMDGFSTTDILHDRPTDFGGGYKPKNYDGRFRGDVTVRRALANSLNVPSVELLSKVGVGRAIDLAKQMGITTLTDPANYGLSLVLGGGEVKLLELTRAYGVLANEGYLVPSHIIERIEDKFGKIIYTYNASTQEENDEYQSDSLFGILNTANTTEGFGQGGKEQVVDAASAYILTHILSDNQARSEVFSSGSALLLDRPAAAKTGTTDDYKDAWTIGYTPQLATGVWIGNNDNAPMGKVAGSIGAAPIWHNIMEHALATYTKAAFPVPGGVEFTLVCAGRASVSCDECTNKVQEVFKIGKRPENACSNLPTTEPSPNPSVTAVLQENTPTPLPSDTPIPTEAPTPTVQPTLLVPTALPQISILPSPT